MQNNIGMKKRTFIKNLSLAALTMPISFKALDQLLSDYAHLDDKTLSKAEDFWAQIRADYSLKPDYIKIDGELMHALMTDKQTQAAVQKIVKGAAERKIKTIAERVENANAMAVLFQLGLDYMQGHYVHEPEVVLEDLHSGKHNTLADLAAANSN